MGEDGFVMRANVLSGLRWGTPPACGHPLKRGISLFVLSYYRANDGVLMGFLVILRRETDWLYRDCFDGGACWVRGRTPPACGHPLKRGMLCVLTCYRDYDGVFLMDFD